jgi:phenylpropionate dioxygenase-like ring-hydroxylating dioxygenase large terminal subunit
MWVKDAWYVAAWDHEIEPGRIVQRSIIDQPLALYRTAAGVVVALEDRCCHRFAPLSLGRLEGDDLRCMYHGLKFAPDGRCIEIPGQKQIPQSACVRHYPAEIVGSWVWVWMGETEAADPAAIPRTIALDDPGYRLLASQIDYDAHYLLIDDNLLDLSHLSFAHEKTIGMDMPQWADLRPSMVPIERGFRFQRWHTGHAPRGFLKRQVGERVDLWNSYDFVFPGIFLQRTGFYPAGTAAASANKEPTAEPLFWRLDEQAVTPVGPRASRYYYAAGARRGDIDDERLGRMFAVTENAFGEDKRIIEAQQKLIDREPGRAMLPTNLDAGPTRFRKLVEGLLQ